MDNRPSIGDIHPRREAPGAPPVPRGMVPEYEPVVPAMEKKKMSANVGMFTASLAPPTAVPEATEVAKAATTPPLPPHHGLFRRFLGSYWHHKLWTLPLTLLLVAAALLAIPASRYPILAAGGMQRQYSVAVTDGKTNTPVSGASVMLDGQAVTTNSAGRTKLMARVGKHVLTIRKKYYQDTTLDLFVGINTLHNTTTIQLVATGRQVPLQVLDKITGKGIAEARIAVLDTEARTDAKGMATIVLPTSSASQPATIAADGYGEANISVQVTDQAVPANTFTLTPAGRVYFLSNQSGTIDVVSANLDGTGRKTVLAGTGNEDPSNTILLPSRDWTSLALLSKRDNSKDAKLYLIATKTGQLTTIDSDAAQITPIGWSDHIFVYQASLDTAPAWQPGQVLLQSYSADSNKPVVIDQSSAAGTEAQYIHQSLAFVNIVGSRVVYGFAWNDALGNYQPNQLGGQKNAILSANVDGSSKQDLRDISIGNGTTYSYMTSVLSKPTTLYVQTSVGTQPAVYYSYQYSNNSVTQSDTLTDSTYTHAQQNYTTYLISPTGRSSLWDLPRDGKNTLFVGDSEGNNGTQIASQSDYSPYGWLTDDYLLVQKGNDELYVMPAAGGSPLKISDYYRPAHNNFYGYGGL